MITKDRTRLLDQNGRRIVVVWFPLGGRRGRQNSGTGTTLNGRRHSSTVERIGGKGTIAHVVSTRKAQMGVDNASPM